MHWLLKALALLLAADLLLVGSWSAIRLCQSASGYSPTEVGPFLVATGVLLALVTLILSRRRDASEDYLKSATDLLAKAYDILDKKDDDGRPKSHRINWLTSARLIKTAERISKSITEEPHQKIWSEQKEYWRGRFHDLIWPDIDGFPKEYYAEKTEHLIAYGSKDREPLSLRSLAVLYRFIRWPDGVEDPLKEEQPFSDEEREKMLAFGPRGLGQLLDELNSLRAKRASPPA